MRKMWSFVKLSCFNLRVMVIKMPKMASFFLFSADDSKKLVTV